MSLTFTQGSREMADRPLLDKLFNAVQSLKSYITVRSAHIPSLPTPGPGKVLMKAHFSPALRRVRTCNKHLLLGRESSHFPPINCTQFELERASGKLSLYFHSD